MVALKMRTKIETVVITFTKKGLSWEKELQNKTVVSLKLSVQKEKKPLCS